MRKTLDNIMTNKSANEQRHISYEFAKIIYLGKFHVVTLRYGVFHVVTKVFKKFSW